MVQVKRSIALAILALVAFSILFQVWQIWRFVNMGGRFTDQDGQALCEALAVLAKESYGYRNSGKPLPNCNYYVEKDQNKLK